MSQLRHVPDDRGILFAEFDWINIGERYGRFTDGGGSIYRDVQHRGRGKASCKILSGATNGNAHEVKYVTMPYAVNVLSFECLVALGLITAGENLDMGIEYRDGTNSSTSFRQARLRYLNSTNKWQYENDVDTYADFPSGAYVADPAGEEPGFASTQLTQTAGDRWAKVKLVVNFKKNEYVRAEIGNQFFDMRGSPVVFRPATTTLSHLFFVLGKQASTSIHRWWTTDWIVREESG